MLNQAHINTEAANTKLIINDIFHNVVFFALSEFKTRIAESDILEIILGRRINIPSPLHIISFRTAYKKGINKIVNVFFQCFVTDSLSFDALEGI